MKQTIILGALALFTLFSIAWAVNTKHNSKVESLQNTIDSLEDISYVQHLDYEATQTEYGVNVENDSILTVYNYRGQITTVHKDTIQNYFFNDNQ